MNKIQKAIEYYKELKREEKEKKILINHKTDWALLEKLIQRCNDNPNLKVEIVLSSGDVIKIATINSNNIETPQFDGVYVVNG